MTAKFPADIYSERATENLPGIVYDANDKKQMYSEDFQRHAEEIIAIENTLGENPQGAYATVKAWLTALAGAVGGGVWGGITGLLSNQTDLKNALDAKQPTLSSTNFGAFIHALTDFNGDDWADSLEIGMNDSDNKIYKTTLGDIATYIVDGTVDAYYQLKLTASRFGALIVSYTAKTIPVDADLLPLTDSAASNAEKKITWANIKATLKTYFDTLYASSASLPVLVGARAYASGGPNIPSGTPTPVPFATNDYDDASFHSTTVNNTRFTVPTGKAGRYRITAQIAFVGNSTGQRFIQIRLNGTTYLAARNVVKNDVNYYTYVGVETVNNLVYADYIEVLAMQDSGAGLLLSPLTYTTFCCFERIH